MELVLLNSVNHGKETGYNFPSRLVREGRTVVHRSEMVSRQQRPVHGQSLRGVEALRIQSRLRSGVHIGGLRERIDELPDNRARAVQPDQSVCDFKVRPGTPRTVLFQGLRD